MRTILLIIALLLPVALVHAQNTAPVQLVGAEQAGYDYGSIAVGDNPRLVIPVLNTGTAPLTISAITGGKDNIKFSCPKNIIKPGKKVYIYATLSPKDPSATGSFKNDVRISFAGNGGAYSFTLSGTVVPNLGIPDKQAPEHKSHNPKAVMRNQSQ